MKHVTRSFGNAVGRALLGASVFGIALATAVIGPMPARADDDKELCASSYESAQKLKREGKLKSARKELVVCGSEKCPSVLVPYCVEMLHDVDAAMPSIVIVAHDPKGQQTQAVRVLVDGEEVAKELDGRPIAIDPGKHHVRYELQGAAPIDEDLIVTSGEQNRRVEPTFKAAGSSDHVDVPPDKGGPTTTSGPVRWPVYLAFGVGGAGLIVGAVTGGLAIGAKSSLDEVCQVKNDCPASAQGDIDKLNTMSAVSTAGFVTAGVGIGVGIILIFALPRGASESTPAKTAKGPRIDPWISPFGGGVRGTF